MTQGILLLEFQLSHCSQFLYFNLDLQNQIRTLSAKNSTHFFPVFSVKTNTNVDTRNNQLVPFSLPDFSTLSEHGDFDLTTGIFTVKTAGMYQLNFNVLVCSSCGEVYCSGHHIFEFQVDGKRKGLLSYNIGQWSKVDKFYQSIHLSAFLCDRYEFSLFSFVLSSDVCDVKLNPRETNIQYLTRIKENAVSKLEFIQQHGS